MKHALMQELDMSSAFAMVWQDVTMTFLPAWRRPNQRLDVLDKVSGYALSGELHCILGASGSGKTSLLQALAGKIASRKFELTGSIEMKGCIVTSAATAKQSSKIRVATIMQDDHLYSHLTVKETLDLAALFYMAKGSSAVQRDRRVAAVMRELHLAPVAQTNVGSSVKRGVSGGERRRVSIARELISAPRILLCDEPTSGLDAASALNVIHTLKALAEAGRVVVAAIHQPRSAIYTAFDRLTLLAEGRLVFSGPRSLAAHHFSLAGYRCPKGFNEADFFVDIMSADGEVEQSRSRCGALSDLYASRSREEEEEEEEGGDGDSLSLRVFGSGGGVGGGESKEEPSPQSVPRTPQSDSDVGATDEVLCESAKRWTILTFVLFQRSMLKNIRFWKEVPFDETLVAPAVLAPNGKVFALSECSVGVLNEHFHCLVVKSKGDAGSLAREQECEGAKRHSCQHVAGRHAQRGGDPEASRHVVAAVDEYHITLALATPPCHRAHL